MFCIPSPFLLLYDRDGYCQSTVIEVMGIDASTPPPSWWTELVTSSVADGGGDERTIADGEGKPTDGVGCLYG